MSHTTDDLVFRWLSEEKVPLFVDPSVELPQLELVSNVTGDCTSVYSTGENTFYLRPVVPLSCNAHCFLIGRACCVCSIWLDRVVVRSYSIEPDSAYMTGTTNQQTGSETIT